MSDVGKGFNVTVGVILALIFFFIILPTGACVGCVVLGAGSAGVAEANRQAEVAQKGPEITVDSLDFKINADNEYMHKISYKFSVTNNRGNDLTKSFKVKFLDGSGFEVTNDVVVLETIPAGSTREFSGLRSVLPNTSPNIEQAIVEEM